MAHTGVRDLRDPAVADQALVADVVDETLDLLHIGAQRFGVVELVIQFSCLGTTSTITGNIISLTLGRLRRNQFHIEAGPPRDASTHDGCCALHGRGTTGAQDSARPIGRHNTIKSIVENYDSI
jgi:hypothetical protein